MQALRKFFFRLFREKGLPRSVRVKRKLEDEFLSQGLSNRLAKRYVAATISVLKSQGVNLDGY